MNRSYRLQCLRYIKNVHGFTNEKYAALPSGTKFILMHDAARALKEDRLKYARSLGYDGIYGLDRQSQRQRGFERPTDYHEHLAKIHGFENHLQRKYSWQFERKYRKKTRAKLLKTLNSLVSRVEFDKKIGKPTAEKKKWEIRFLRMKIKEKSPGKRITFPSPPTESCWGCEGCYLSPQTRQLCEYYRPAKREPRMGLALEKLIRKRVFELERFLLENPDLSIKSLPTPQDKGNSEVPEASKVDSFKGGLPR